MSEVLTAERFENGILPPVWVTLLPPFNGTWITLADYKVTLLQGTLLIPINFQFDLASIPRPIRALINTFQLSLVAPLVHDYLYQNAGHFLDVATGQQRAMTRQESDLCFHSLMLQEGVPATRAQLAYLGVRVGGWVTWSRVVKQRERALRSMGL